MKELSSLAGKVMGLISSKGKAPVPGIARDLGAAPKDVEDALGFLVRNEYLPKDFKLVDWNYAAHKKSRPKKPKPVQALLFGAPSLLDKRKKKRIVGEQSDYATDTTDTPTYVNRLTVKRTKDVMVKLTGMSADKWLRESGSSLEVDGWEIKNWKEYGAIGSSPAHLIVTLTKEIEVFDDKTQEAQSSQTPKAAKDWKPWRGSPGQPTGPQRHKVPTRVSRCTGQKV